MDWGETPMTTCTTCMLCATITGICMEATTLLTARTPSMVSGTASMTARFHQSLMMMCASRQPIFCSIRGGQLFPPGRLTALLLVQLVRPCVITGSTGYLAAGLLAWPLELRPGAPLWLHWLSRLSFQENAVRMTEDSLSALL